MPETLRWEEDGTVVTLTLCRPDLRNRIDERAHAELEAAFRRLRDRHDVRAVVLAAEGKAFSAGGDFDLMRRAHADPSARRTIVDDGWALLEALLHVPQPVVAAVQGDAVGLGATVALACDAVVTHPTCRIFDPHVQVGLVAGDGGALLWPAHAGMAVAKRHLLWGAPLEGEAAHRLGLVSDLVAERDEVGPTARRLADEVAALPPLAVQSTKRVLAAALRHRFHEVMALGLELEAVTMASADHAEAVEAMAERRPPVFHGR
ncbi:MAG TPA: enoyl-CoA hydratase/isomerase family protein [Iamia sp.]|nr:enoyl-CoA hydratase/isomerase family protein [Iamia sp.]